MLAMLRWESTNSERNQALFDRDGIICRSVSSSNKEREHGGALGILSDWGSYLLFGMSPCSVKN